MMQLTLNRIAKIRVLVLGVFLAALMAASLTLAAHPAHASTTFTVDSTADYGDQTPETANATRAPSWWSGSAARSGRPFRRPTPSRARTS